MRVLNKYPQIGTDNPPCAENGFQQANILAKVIKQRRSYTCYHKQPATGKRRLPEEAARYLKN